MTTPRDPVVPFVVIDRPGCRPSIASVTPIGHSTRRIVPVALSIFVQFIQQLPQSLSLTGTELGRFDRLRQ